MHLEEDSDKCLISRASSAEQLICKTRYQGQSHLVTISLREEPQFRTESTPASVRMVTLLNQFAAIDLM
jgi:hypothetical protein